jgi:sec-independent protein translocase protein TatB
MVLQPTIQTASIGIPDTLFLMVLALVVFGPRRLPEIGRKIGKLMYEFRKVSNDFRFQMEEELRMTEEAERLQKLQAIAAPAAPMAELGVPPHPVSEAPLELTSGTEHDSSADATSTEVAPALSSGPPEDELPQPADEVIAPVAGEVRSGPPWKHPVIQPPTSGDIVEAQRPFRGRIPESAAEPVTESGDPATHVAQTPVIVADEGRVGTEVQPGTETNLNGANGSEREAHHV